MIMTNLVRDQSLPNVSPKEASTNSPTLVSDESERSNLRRTVESRNMHAVRWSDLDDEHHTPTSSMINFGSSREPRTLKAPSLKTRKRVDSVIDEKPEPQEHLLEPIPTPDDLLSQLKKKEEKIRRACKLELHFLNQSKRICYKRMQLVSEMQQMKRKLRKVSVEAANRDHFHLPPVFCDIKNDPAAMYPTLSVKSEPK
jgi:hypothetical protein